MMWHWLDVELWGPMWPNMFAPSVITLIAVAVSHVRAHRQRERHHREMKQHVTNSTSAGARDLRGQFGRPSHAINFWHE